MRPCGFMPPGRFCVLMGRLRVMLARSHSPVPLPAAFVSVTRQPTTETEVNMAIINLRDYYPFYTSDCFMEVSEEVAEMFKEFDRKEAAYRLRTYRHKAYYSLDRDDGLEHEAVFVALSPHELYERKVTMQELHAAISSLPDKQAKRIYGKHHLPAGTETKKYLAGRKNQMRALWVCSESHPCTKQHRLFPLYQTDGKQRLSGLRENPQRRI